VSDVKDSLKIEAPTEPEIHLERIFDAPRDLVFASFTDPELITEWWGPGTAVDQMDVARGRHLALHDEEPGRQRGRGRRDLPGGHAPERLVYTFGFEGAPSSHTETHEFDDLGR
jgi:uncharacterized protein YndB with AHSA1/START domain